MIPPTAPVVGVGGLVVRDGKVLLIRRGKQPLFGRWTLPGGTLELGESLEEAVVRELLEETGVRVRPLELLTVFDRIERADGRVVYHYVIVDYLCEYLSGEPQGASDALEAAFVSEAELPALDLPAKGVEVVADGLRRARALARDERGA